VVRSNREIRPGHVRADFRSRSTPFPQRKLAMIKASFSSQGTQLDAAAVRACAAAARVDLGQHTRALNKTGARRRSGKHAALSPEEKARRRDERRARANTRQLEQETMVEAVRARTARRRQEREEERETRWRIGVRLDPGSRPKVTAAGGRKLERRPARFERAVLPLMPARERRTGVVFRIKARLLGTTGMSRWRRGEATRFGRYLVRLSGLETSPAECVWTNIVGDDVPKGSDEFVQQLSGFLTSVEQLETACDPQGQVYKSIIVPLPYEVGIEGRKRVAAAYAAALRRRNLPFLIVLHAPDPGGDQRNTHMHIMVMMRAFDRIGDWNWQFAATKARDVFHPAMLKVWRRFTVTTLNRELARVGSTRRYTLTGQGLTAEHDGPDATRRKRAASADLIPQRERQLDQSKAIHRIASIMISGAVRLDAVASEMNKSGSAALRRKVLALALLVAAASARQARLAESSGLTIERAKSYTALLQLQRRAGQASAAIDDLNGGLERLRLQRGKLQMRRALLLRLRVAPVVRQQRVITRTVLSTLHGSVDQQRGRGVTAFERTARAGRRAALNLLVTDTRLAIARVSVVEEQLQAGTEAAIGALRQGAVALRAHLRATVAVATQAHEAVHARRSARQQNTAFAKTDSSGDRENLPDLPDTGARAPDPDTSIERTPDITASAKDAEAKSTPAPLVVIPADGAEASQPFDMLALVRAEKKRRALLQESLRGEEGAIAETGISLASATIEAVGRAAYSVGQGVRALAKRVHAPAVRSLKLPVAPAPPATIAKPSVERATVASAELSRATAIHDAVERFDRRARSMTDDARDACGVAIPLVRLAIRQGTASMWFCEGHIHLGAEDASTLALMTRLAKFPAGRELLADRSTDAAVPDGWQRERIVPDLALTRVDRSFHARGTREWSIDVSPIAERNRLVRAELMRSVGLSGTNGFELAAVAEMLDDTDFRCSILVTGSADRPLLRLAAVDPDDLVTLGRIASTEAGRALLVRLAALDMLGSHLPPLHWNDRTSSIAPDELAKAMPDDARYIHWDGFDHQAHLAKKAALEQAVDHAVDGIESERRQREKGDRASDPETEVCSQSQSVVDRANFMRDRGRGR